MATTIKIERTKAICNRLDSLFSFGRKAFSLRAAHAPRPFDFRTLALKTPSPAAMASGFATTKPSINLNENLPSEEDLQSLDSPTVTATAPTTSKTAGAATTVELHAASTVPVNDIGRRMRRAERFGLPVHLSEEEKRNSRAERFGSLSGPNKSDAVNKSENLKRKARAERFGMQVPSMTADEEAKKKARSARFSSGLKTDPQEEDKRKLRAIRFSDIPSSWNGKAAIAGKASGLA